MAAVLILVFTFLALEGSSNFIGPLSSMGGFAGGASSAGGVYDLAYMAV